MSGFIERSISPFLSQQAEWFPAVSLTGPRQSGKSTLAKKVFSNYEYVNLEDPALRARAAEDPMGFIRSMPDRLIVDEAQYVPDIYSAIQVVSDERDVPGQYILTGSQNYLMMKGIGQSLAGRVGLLKLLPLSFSELYMSKSNAQSVSGFMLKGGYPRLYDSKIPPQVYYESYVKTYMERDVTDLMGIRNKASFQKMLSICAECAGNLLNVSSAANAIGVSTNTVRSWLSILESSYIVFMLQPYFENTRKRLAKRPKLYFYDTGLLCHLLGIGEEKSLLAGDKLGPVFENMVVAETMKAHFNAGRAPRLYFYRDDSKREIDLLDFTDGSSPKAFEIKSSTMNHSKYSRYLRTVCPDIGIKQKDCAVIYRGDSSFESNGFRIVAAEDYLLSISDVRKNLNDAVL